MKAGRCIHSNEHMNRNVLQRSRPSTDLGLRSLRFSKHIKYILHIIVNTNSAKVFVTSQFHDQEYRSHWHTFYRISYSSDNLNSRETNQIHMVLLFVNPNINVINWVSLHWATEGKVAGKLCLIKKIDIFSNPVTFKTVLRYQKSNKFFA